MGAEWIKHVDNVCISERLAITGPPMETDDDISHLKIHDHENNITKIVFEWHVRQIVDPLLSKVAFSIFKDNLFMPNEKTMDMVKVSQFRIKYHYDRKYNNFCLNFCGLDNEVQALNYKVGDTKYDILEEVINSLIKCGPVIKIDCGHISPPIDYSVA